MSCTISRSTGWQFRTITAATLVLSPLLTAQGQTPEGWFANGQAALATLKKTPINDKPAKNVILMIGDGMGVTTVTAARILEGQLRGVGGEENQLFFETFPWSALSKTYSANQQIADSAPTATALVTGVKANDAAISVNQNAVRGKYKTTAGNELRTILELAEQNGLSTGVVTTATVTHATPAACYAHSPERGWENDSGMPLEARKAGFPDIARQLVEFPHGNGLEVALGGGRQHFLPKTAADHEEVRKTGSRLDGLDLTAQWTQKYENSAYVWNQAQFAAIDPMKTSHLLGLFERSYMRYTIDRAKDVGGEPTLPEMTTKAIQILSRNPKGYFLMVEGGRIDHGHHAGNPRRALTETIELAAAVKVAREMTGEDTLIVVTADHSHTLTMAGYSYRGNDILGLARGGDKGKPSKRPALDMLLRPYTTLSYANGPGYPGVSDRQPEGPKRYPHTPTYYEAATNDRPLLTADVVASADFLPETGVPLGSETHGGEDVPVYADGPNAHLFRGTIEQNVIYHIMADALRLK